MAAFKALRDVSMGFENYSRQVAAELFSAKISEPFEDVVNKKLRDVKLYTSKLRLLEAKSFAETPQISEKIRNEDTILEYEDAVSSKIIEQLVVKAITQSHTVQNLLTKPSHQLRPEFVEKKERIIEELTKYRQNEIELRSLENELENREAHLLEVRRRWDKVVGKLRDTPKVAPNEAQMDGPLYKTTCATYDKLQAVRKPDSTEKSRQETQQLLISCYTSRIFFMQLWRLQTISEKMEMMRWLVAKLVTSRYDEDYDWSTDPHRRLQALAVARQRKDVY